MCGRIDQNQTARFYASTFGWADAVYDSQSEPHYNVSPGTFRPVMHIEQGERRVDDDMRGANSTSIPIHFNFNNLTLIEYRMARWEMALLASVEWQNE